MCIEATICIPCASIDLESNQMQVTYQRLISIDRELELYSYRVK